MRGLMTFTFSPPVSRSLLRREKRERLLQEVPDQWLLRSLDLADGFEREDSRLIQHENSIRDPKRAGHVVRDDHARDLELSRELVNQIVHRVRRDRIEA